MEYFDSKRARNMNKFYRENFSLGKFKMKIVLASINLWDIVAGFQCVEGIGKACQEGHVYNSPQCGRKPTFTNLEL